MSNVAVVTGAGSGVGRAIALRLSTEGYTVALVGRTASSLDQTISLAKSPPAKLLPIPCDISDEAEVAAMAQRVAKELGDVSVLVNSAGTNIARRSLDTLSIEDY